MFTPEIIAGLALALVAALVVIFLRIKKREKADGAIDAELAALAKGLADEHAKIVAKASADFIAGKKAALGIVDKPKAVIADVAKKPVAEVKAVEAKAEVVAAPVVAEVKKEAAPLAAKALSIGEAIKAGFIADRRHHVEASPVERRKA